MHHFKRILFPRNTFAVFLQTLHVAKDRFAEIILDFRERRAVGMKPRQKRHKTMESFRLVRLDDSPE